MFEDTAGGVGPHVVGGHVSAVALSRGDRVSFLFFFFQAEDGIRDLTVTGVQTCALPIFPGRKNEVAQSIARRRQWLLTAEPKSAEERAMLLMGLAWSEAPHARVASAIKDVRDHQEASGGWSQFGRTPPDAYATGMSLYALHTAGVPTTDAAYREGVAFLLSTQYADGAWFVRSHSFPIQRYFESGFPFGRHQWISSAGTSWAALAIAQTLPESKD